MAATSGGAAPSSDRSAALIAAALALPGILPAAALAQSAPDEGVVALRYYDYRDWQPGVDRMSVRSPSLYAFVPLSDSLTVEGSLVYDSVSGASPLYHDAVSGASGRGIGDYRSAADAKVTKYFGDSSLAVGAAYSHEQDYISRAASVEWRTWSDDRNRTYAIGFGAAKDRINALEGVNAPVLDRPRETYDYLLGITQVLDARSVVESSITWSDGRGYFSDPYKLHDARPDHRRILAWLTHYNRYFAAPDATLQLGYRYLDDSFGDRSHMLEASWVQTLTYGLTLTPTIRYLTQSAAYFYRDPPFPQGFVPGQLYTADERLSAFGAITLGVRLAKELPHRLTIDVAFNAYRQRGDWRLGGHGSPGLAEFSARWIEFGLAKRF
ncbi:MAG TPA: DUF3570 domain-containing protein [Casimicrobiaceae bacterium]|nr:DUF3570 domain-containing protein [Casimicrobiaceae bacterium]